jgi:hypothetical protein
MDAFRYRRAGGSRRRLHPEGIATTANAAGFYSRTTARIERNMMVRLVGHLLKVDLSVLAPRTASGRCMAAFRAAWKALSNFSRLLSAILCPLC